MEKAKIAVFKFSSCDGCQLSLLDCEDELLLIAEATNIAYFMEATRKQVEGPYDITLIEGSITTDEEVERIKSVRQQSKFLVVIGACATSGGIQALKNFQHVDEFINTVYAHPEYISSLETSRPISDYVAVDFELRGCPINKNQLLEVLSAFLQNRKPNISNSSVCFECKQKALICLQVSQGIPCLGSVTHSGCGALCPAYNRGCFACYGPKEQANTESLARWFEEQMQITQPEIVRYFRSFNAQSDTFRTISEAYDKKND